MTNFPTNVAAMIDHFEQQADQIRDRYHALSDAAKVMYVIECGGLLINPNGGDELGEKVCTLSSVPTYSKFDVAQSLADRVVNGAGTRGKVTTLGAAYLDTVRRYMDIAATLRQANGIA
jgi:hypothetical protein